jgi:hypothetical protein
MAIGIVNNMNALGFGGSGAVDNEILDRLPSDFVEGTNYPIVQTSDIDNGKGGSQYHAITDMRLYVPSAWENDDYMIYECGYYAATQTYRFAVLRYVGGVSQGGVGSFIVAVPGLVDSSAGIKYYPLIKAEVTNYNCGGWLKIDWTKVKNTYWAEWAVTNKPYVVPEVVKTSDFRQINGLKYLGTNSEIISNVNALFAHEASLVVTNDYVYCAYCLNLTTLGEAATNEQALMIRKNKSTGQLTTITVATQGETYGSLTIAADKVPYLPRLFKLPNGKIRAYFTYTGDYLPYYRDYDEATETFGDAYEFTAVIFGGSTPVSLTTANLRAHCEGITGTTGTYFNSLWFLVRNCHEVIEVAGKFYLLGEMDNGVIGIPVLMESANGYDWTLKGISYLPLETENPKYIETMLAYAESKFYLFSRFNDGFTTYSSSNDGLTFTNYYFYGTFQFNFPFGSNGLRSGLCKINYKGVDYNLWAYSHIRQEYRSVERTCLALSYSVGVRNNVTKLIFNNLKMCHYPTIAVDGNYLWIAYTTSESTKVGANSLKNTIRLVKVKLSNIFNF